ncbi:2-phospho-L-lactate guanylyltransferase [Xylanimonas cellulosilytica]|uniref:2-phospho-L-lactate guanylyltransferase n=1 Tax=Xylanimonas cellulosilytica TaxID=186189 RepID=UPI001FE0E2A0|nr:2-phospho-L-lactate guanylyltransferase [Xylanimonas cellulosilytica]
MSGSAARERPGVSGRSASSGSSGSSGVVAVVPLRDGASGKSRLAAGLTPTMRRRLVTELARHVVGVLAASPGVAWIAVVTADPGFVTDALAGLPVRVLPQPADQPGLNAALDVGRETVRAAAPGAALLVAHADLPDLTADDVAALLAAAHPSSPAPTVVVATDRHGAGTNLLLLPAAVDFTFRFGPGSRAAHEAEAARRGLRAVVVDRPGTAADLDTLDDWEDLPAETRTHLTG